MFRPGVTVKFIIGLSVAKPNQKMSRAYVEKRQNGGLIFQIVSPIPLAEGPSFEGEGMG